MRESFRYLVGLNNNYHAIKTGFSKAINGQTNVIYGLERRQANDMKYKNKSFGNLKKAPVKKKVQIDAKVTKDWKGKQIQAKQILK